MNLDRAALRKLRPGESAHAHGVVYTRLPSDGRWSVNVMVNRKRHHFVIGLESEGYTKSQAEEAINKLRASKREEAHGLESPKHAKRLTVANAVTDYLKYLETHDGRDIDKKRARFEQHITPELGRIALDRLTDDDWRRYVAGRKGEGASPATINRERSALLHLLNTARRRKLIRGVPQLDRQREPEGKLVYLSPEQARRLINAAEKDSSTHALNFVMIALYTGMRQSPILNLTVGDIDCDRRVIWVGKDKAGRREQPMPEILAEYLRPLTKAMPSETLLFASRRAESGRLFQVNAIFARCVERAGLSRDVTPHTMRHTAATNAAHAGIDAATIQAIGGWKTRAMAERYTHAAQLSAAMDALQNRLNGRRTTPKLHRARRRRA
jgi:integrase